MPSILSFIVLHVPNSQAKQRISSLRSQSSYLFIISTSIFLFSSTENAVVVKDGVLKQWKGGNWEVVSEQEVKKYLLAAGIGEAELDTEYNYLMQRLAQIG